MRNKPISYYVYRHVNAETGKTFWVDLAATPRNTNRFTSKYRHAMTQHWTNHNWSKNAENKKYYVEIIHESENVEDCKNTASAVKLGLVDESRIKYKDFRAVTPEGVKFF